MYIYNATGVKLKKTVNVSITDYAGNYIYENDELQFFNHPEGYATPVNAADYDSGFDYVYQYKDHLGNVRLSYTDNNGNLEIVEENNYYPFGLKMRGFNENVSPNGNSTAQKFKFQGQEFSEELGLNNYEFGLRQYDASLGRWFNTDPYEQFDSPYVAMGNNPVVSVDPDGGYCYDSQGNQVACPDSDIFDDYRDNEDNHIEILDEVDLDANNKKEEEEVYQGTRKEWFQEYHKAKSDAAFEKEKREFIRKIHAKQRQGGMFLLTTLSVINPWSFAIGGASAGVNASARALTTRTTQNGVNYVYVSVVNGKTIYAGITNNLARRTAEHLAKKGINISPLLKGLSRTDARNVEQALIFIHKLGKNGGTLINKINSISAKDPAFQ